MSIFEYDAEKETRLIREAEFAEGEAKGEARTKKIYQYAQAGRTPIEIAEKMGIPEEKVREILAPVELE